MDTPAILGLGTAVPRYRFSQQLASDWMQVCFGDQPALARWLRSLYRLSGIDQRHTCLVDSELGPERSRFAPHRPPAETPTTSERMLIFEQEAPRLAREAADRAIADLAEVEGSSVAAVTDSITHVVAVSCTGFFAPGLDLALCRELGLRPTVRRTMVGFMGCAAAFNGLRLADAAVRADPAARVLIVCVELCTLHMQPGTERMNFIVGSLFADGAAATIVGSPTGGEAFAIEALHTSVAPATDTQMVWRVGDHGFTLYLSPEIPRRLGEIGPSAVEAVMGNERPEFWAIHPGGPGIVDRLVDVLGLTEADVQPTRETLRGHGNMSSPTILFVLDAHRRRLRAIGRPATGIAMAFGPGLVTEVARLSYQPAPVLAGAGNRHVAVA